MPAANSYYAPIDVVTRDASGYITPLVGETVRLRVVGGANIADLVTGDYGYIEGDLMSGISEGTYIEFVSLTKTGTLRQRSGATLASTFSEGATLVLDDDFVTTKDSIEAEIYIQNNSDPSVVPIYLGTVKKEETRKFPFFTPSELNIDILALSKTGAGEYAATSLNDAASVNLSSAGGTGRRIFSRYADVATSGLSSQDLYSDTLPAGKLAANGDSIRAVYAGTFAANANQKLVWVDWFGQAFTEINTTQNGGSWRVEVEAIRVSSTIVRIAVFYSYGTSSITVYEEKTGLTLSSSQALKLRGRSPSAAGDLTARMGFGDYFGI